MTDYTKLTDFASKDALPTGTPAKIVKGTEIDDEFQAIETAIGTKANVASPVFTGSPAAPTASSGTNTTQIATTAFVQTAVSAVDMSTVWPVGSVYINAAVDTNPSTLLGFGTWVEIGAGKVLIGQDTGDTDFDVLGETGGSKEHTLTTNEMPAHSHTYANEGAIALSASVGAQTAVASTSESSSSTSTVGGGAAFDIMNPYIVVKMWQRTA